MGVVVWPREIFTQGTDGASIGLVKFASIDVPLNLSTDPWLPVLDSVDARQIIAPWQMADPALVRPDWPRADLNLACLNLAGLELAGLELLIGLVFLAAPPPMPKTGKCARCPIPNACVPVSPLLLLPSM